MLRREFIAAAPFLADQAREVYELMQGRGPVGINDPFGGGPTLPLDDPIKDLIEAHGFVDPKESLERARRAARYGWTSIGVWAGYKRPLSRSALVGVNPKTGMVEFLPPVTGE